jgi:LPPG:FO 2-phospho-L-lactate transferase
MKIVALAGGVGGAKLVAGLAQVLSAEDLTVIVNTGDDFDHLGLRICPDLDTVCYTLAGLANPETGWGLKDETWNALESLKKLGGPAWFGLGDHDLGTHLERSRRLNTGFPLSTITREFCRQWGVNPTVLPMTDDKVATRVHTAAGDVLAFQEYFVHQHCEPEVKGFRFEGVETCHPAPGVLESLEGTDLVILCPSNPWVSIGPILAVPGIKEEIQRHPTIAVSPIIGGKAVKGPAAKMYTELGFIPSAKAVASQFRELLTGFVIDRIDRDQVDEISGWGIILHVTDTLMFTTVDRQRLALEIVRFGEALTRR